MLDYFMCSAAHLAVSKREEEFVEVDQDYFHSRCTGNAERQLSVLGSGFSVGVEKPVTDLCRSRKAGFETRP